MCCPRTASVCNVCVCGSVCFVVCIHCVVRACVSGLLPAGPAFLCDVDACSACLGDFSYPRLRRIAPASVSLVTHRCSGLQHVEFMCLCARAFGHTQLVCERGVQALLDQPGVWARRLDGLISWTVACGAAWLMWGSLQTRLWCHEASPWGHQPRP